MGLLDEIEAKATPEAGFSFVDTSNRAIGTLPAGATEATKEIEIIRPTLAKILLGAAKSLNKVDFRHGCTIIGDTTERIKRHCRHRELREEIDLKRDIRFPRCLRWSHINYTRLDSPSR